MRRVATLLAFALLLSACTFGGASGTPSPTETIAPTSANTTSPNLTLPPATTVAAASTAIPTTSSGGTQKPATNTTKSIPANTPTTRPTAVPSTPAPGGIAVAPEALSSPRVMAWNPNTNTLGWYATKGQPLNLLDKQSGKSLAALICAVNPSGDRAAVFVGADKAQPILYPLGGGTPISLGETHALTCALQGLMQFSTDGNQLALIKYVTLNKFAAGTLRILKMPEAAQLHTVDNVASFQLYTDGILFFQIFPSSTGEGTRASLHWWDGTTERSLEDEIKPLQDCQFINGRSVRVDKKVYSLLAEKCKSNAYSWRLMSTDFAGSNSANFVQGPSRNFSYVPNADLNDMWVFPDNAAVMIAVPNGLNTDVVDLLRVSLTDGKITPVLPGVIIDQFPVSFPRRFLRSPAGDKLALVTREGNKAETLYVYDLTKPTTAPVMIAGGNSKDRINNVAWSADSQKLFYITDGDSVALNLLSVSTGDRKIVSHGNLGLAFQGLAVSPDGAIIATSKPNQISPNEIHNDLILISVADQKETPLVAGAKGEAALMPLLVR